MDSVSIMPEVPYLTSDESLLSRRFGKEIVNYYAGGTLNRYSFLRADTAFLRKAASSPNARFIALNKLNPLVAEKTHLVYLSFEDVKPLIGADPFSLTEDEYIKQYDSSKPRPLMVFLGMLEGRGTASEEIATSEHGPVKGSPYFAVDITPNGPLSEAATALLKKQEEQGRSIQTNPRSMLLHAEAGTNP
jgi:NAD+ diphosphatase